MRRNSHRSSARLSLGQWAVGRPGPTLALCTALSLFFAYQAATGLRMDSTVEAVMTGESDALHLLRRLQDNFGEDAVLELVVEGDVFSLSYLERLRTLHRELEELRIPELAEADASSAKAPPVEAEATVDGPGDEFAFADSLGTVGPAAETDLASNWLSDIRSLINAREMEKQGGALAAGELLEPWPTAADLPALRERVRGNPRITEQLVDGAGKASLVIVRPMLMHASRQAHVYTRVRAVAERLDAPGFRVSVGGMPALEAQLSALTVADMTILLGVSHGLALLCLLWLYRRPLAAIGPALVLLQAMLWTLGLMALCDVPLTVISAVLPGILTAVGLAGAVHLQSAYRELRGRGVGGVLAARLALRRTSKPIVFTTLTTAAGLLSLQQASLDAIGDLGRFGAFGVLSELALTLVFLPAFVTFDRGQVRRPGPQPFDVIERVLALSARVAGVMYRGRSADLGRVGLATRGRVALAVTAILCMAAGALAQRVPVTQDVLSYIPKDAAPHRAFAALDEYFGGAGNVVLLVEAGGEHGLANRELMLALEQLERHIRSYRASDSDASGPQPAFVGRSLSALDAVRESWRAMHDGDPSFDRLPDTQRGISDALFLFEGAAPDELAEVLTVDRRLGAMFIRVRWTDARSYSDFVAHVRDGVARYIGDRARVDITGSVFNQARVGSQILGDMVASLSLAFALVLTLIAVGLRNIRIALVAMVPNVVPVILALGYMGATRTPLDPSNVLVASIVLGIVVDDTIHFFHHFQDKWRRTGDVDRAISHTLERVGRAAIVTSLLLCCEFTVNVFADIASIRAFGVLSTISLAAALVADLLLVPVLLRLMFGKPDAMPAKTGAVTAQEEGFSP